MMVPGYGKKTKAKGELEQSMDTEAQVGVIAGSLGNLYEDPEILIRLRRT
jgi:hypothetical protein